ncbi:hypothetical protein DIE28_07640 [Paracoccus thiocyanatus]|uniref:Uncharacterized protein n=1 Tax=Paracoccus thiocyanatus TaxID=34006 RepID=A0A3D8PE70_9RHOB|nr:hypothetical protein DIE28_07640 [Paracoccus thiocyanatus]
MTRKPSFVHEAGGIGDTNAVRFNRVIHMRHWVTDAGSAGGSLFRPCPCVILFLVGRAPHC